MAHWKRIAQHPFKPTDADSLRLSLATKDGGDREKKYPPTGLITKPTVNDLRSLTESDNMSEQNEIQPHPIRTPLSQSIPQAECAVRKKVANTQTEKEAEFTKAFRIQQLANIRNPHEHDVLMGRGNMKYHPGNQFFRNLVKQYSKQYISSCKNEKGIYTRLIMDEVSMRVPPGRFLTQDTDTQLWVSIGHKKALEKTRQALREGANDAKFRARFGSTGSEVGEQDTCCSGSGQKWASNAQDHISRTSSQNHRARFSTDSEVGEQDTCSSGIGEKWASNSQDHISRTSSQKNRARFSTSSEAGEQGTCCSGSGEKGGPSSNAQDHISRTSSLKSRARFSTGSEAGEQDTCCLGSKEKGGTLSNAQDHISKTKSQKILMTPDHVGTLDDSISKKPSFRPPSRSSSCMNSEVTTTAPAQRKQSGNNLLMNTGAANNAAPINTGATINAATNKVEANEKLASSVAARLMKSNGINDGNIENLVALGILALLNGGGSPGNNSTQNTVPSTVTGDQYRMSDERTYEPSIESPTNTVVATNESAGASGVAKTSKAPKRGLWKQMSDISLMSNKKWKHTPVSYPPPSLAKDSVGTEARTNAVVTTDESAGASGVAKEMCNTTSKAPKRGLWKQMSDISLMSNKKWKHTPISYPPPSLAKDSVGTEARTNVVVTIDESAGASGVAEEVCNTTSKAPKRGLWKQMSDISLMSNKKWKHTPISYPPPSLAKDSDGAEKFLAMSHGDDGSEGEYSNGSDKNGVASIPPEPNLSLPPELTPLSLSNHKQHASVNGIYSTPSLGNFMQCDTCLGAGILPIPTSAISTLQSAPRDLLPNPASNIGDCSNPEEILSNNNLESSGTIQVNAEILLDNYHESSVTCQSKDPSTSIGVPTAQQIDKECGSSFKEVVRSPSILTDKIRQVEKKWNIALDENKNFMQRIEEIEKKALFCRKVLQGASIFADKNENKTLTVSLKEVELAEEQWGMTPTEHYNIKERVEMIEQTSHSFIQRLKILR